MKEKTSTHVHWTYSVMLNELYLLLRFETIVQLLGKCKRYQQQIQLVARQVHNKVLAVVRIELFAKRVQLEVPPSSLTHPLRIVHCVSTPYVLVQSAVKMADYAKREYQLQFKTQIRHRHQNVETYRRPADHSPGICETSVYFRWK